ncbi:MAG: TetR/AcrR family transcriptional regulator [Clostridiales bacterium]|nr:TetR/AcrR family transcriptional regulator [Clostridiales bacterium]
MDYRLSNMMKDDIPTRQKILLYALEQFSEKGYADTTIRDIAMAVGITSGSIYSHFSSKEEILQNMLNDYAKQTAGMFHSIDIVPILQEKPTGEGIAYCIMSSITPLTDDVYYANLVHLIHQEQHRNNMFGKFVLVRLQETTDFVMRIIAVLKEMKVIAADADVEYCGLLTFSLLYSIPTIYVLNIRQGLSGYTLKDIPPTLSKMFDAMIQANRPSGE